MKSKKWFFGSLKEMLGYYESYRVVLKMSKEDAVNKTLETYSDFYEVMNK
jgi:hypothetical protein